MAETTVNIRAENYRYKEEGDVIFVYNSVYEGHMALLLLTALLSAFAPDIRDLSIPLAIEIRPGRGEEILVGEDLSVRGGDRHSYFIPRSHYTKWKRTFLSSYLVLLLLILAIDTFFVYSVIHFDGAGRFVMAAILIATLLLSSLLLRRIYGQIVRRRQYPVRDVLFF